MQRHLLGHQDDQVRQRQHSFLYSLQTALRPSLDRRWTWQVSSGRADLCL